MALGSTATARADKSARSEPDRSGVVGARGQPDKRTSGPPLSQGEAISRSTKVMGVMAITKCLISAQTVNRFTVTARALRQVWPHQRLEWSGRRF